MKKIKKSLMALAAFCAITTSANAYTLGMSVHYPGIIEYNITFFQEYKDSRETWGKCNFCWYDTCYKFNYIYDGYQTVIIEEIGVYILDKNKNRLYELPFSRYFKSGNDK